MSNHPTVSIGLPVYNGARFLPQALDSLLAQTFDDFEIVISDNASTDETEAIARAYAAQDERVRYHRLLSNVGAGANFNRVFELSRGRYFKWAAHDDICAPTFLERCVELLERDAGAVLAYTRVIEMDEIQGEERLYEVKLATDDPSSVLRFQELLRGHRCYEIFGLIRRDALARTPLMGAYAHGDGVLLARLAFLGRFEEVPEPLFHSRIHDRQSGMMIGDEHSYAAWFTPALQGRICFPVWRIFFEFWRSILMTHLSFEDFARCHLILARKVYSWRRVLGRDLRVASTMMRDATTG